jgi:hypothetical protein
MSVGIRKVFSGKGTWAYETVGWSYNSSITRSSRTNSPW